MDFSIPTAGSVVKVTTRFKSTCIYDPPFKESTYVGRVLPPEKYFGPTEFLMLDTERERVINLRNVIALDILEGSSVPVDLPKTIEVKGSKGNVYTVSSVGNRVTCTCPSFTYRRFCKHLSMLQSC